MAEFEEDPKDNQPFLTSPAVQSPLVFLEVLCKASGKARRFSVGTEAGFALGLINKKLRDQTPVLVASHIEAIKEGEEPISFGHSSVLVNYGPGWKLQTVLDPRGFPSAGDKGRIGRAYDKVTGDPNTIQEKAETGISGVYLGKIILAFVLIFVLGTIFMLLLDNLPKLIFYMMNSSL